MITVDQLDATAIGVLLRVARRWLFFQPSTGHYVWGANGPLPRTATTAEAEIIVRFGADQILRSPRVMLDGTVSVCPTEAGKRLVAQLTTTSDAAASLVVANYGPPYSVKDALDGADRWVVHALRMLAYQPGSFADVRDKLRTAKELISEARVDLGGS